MLRDYTEVPRMRLHPGLDAWITLNRTGEPQELIHDRYTRNRMWELFEVLRQRPRSPMSAGNKSSILDRRSMDRRGSDWQRGAVIRCIGWFGVLFRFRFRGDESPCARRPKPGPES